VLLVDILKIGPDHDLIADRIYPFADLERKFRTDAAVPARAILAAIRTILGDFRRLHTFAIPFMQLVLSVGANIDIVPSGTGISRIDRSFGVVSYAAIRIYARINADHPLGDCNSGQCGIGRSQWHKHAETKKHGKVS